MLFTRCGICGKKILNFIKNKKINSFNDYWKQVSIDWRQTYAELNINQDLLIVFVDHLLNIVKEFKDLEK